MAFGVSLETAWTMTVPDFLGLLAAHKRIHGGPEAKGGARLRLTPGDVTELREAMKQAETDETRWRVVGARHG